MAVNLKVEPPVKPTFVSLGAFLFKPGSPAEVEITAEGANGTIHSDIVQLLPVK